MKTIEEAAIESAANNINKAFDKNGLNTNCHKLAFKKGVEFAQRWIPVTEELPKETDHGFSDLVLTKCGHGLIYFERYDFEYKHFNQVRYDAKEKGDGQVKFWRPIDLK
jgi:hypothetical protein